ncbi:MAG: PD-(D/E)XK nuclease family protein, partial [Bacillota bacterium]|nr:PD-(D/E)XK nuclease family protein [Bacillota bacterium]
CGYRYWLSRVCGFQPLLARELGFGRLLHHLVAELARQAASGREPGPEDVDRLVERSFYLPFAGTIPGMRLRESARRRVKAYVRGYGRELTRTVQPEMSFEVPLGDARLRGRVDLVLAVGEKGKRRVELIDFKTAENRPPSEAHKNQLRLYAVAVERLGYEPVGLYVHDLDREAGGRVAVTDDARARSAFEDELRGLIEGIRAGRFDPAASATACSGCDFWAFCPHRA